MVDYWLLYAHTHIHILSMSVCICSSKFVSVPSPSLLLSCSALSSLQSNHSHPSLTEGIRDLIEHTTDVSMVERDGLINLPVYMQDDF